MSHLCRTLVPAFVLFLLVGCDENKADPTPGTPDTSISPTSTAGPVGKLFGPIPSQVAVSIGEEQLSATVSASDPTLGPAPQAYAVGSFTFAKPLDATTTYSVNLGASAPNQSCAVLIGASGTGAELSAAGGVRAGCEWSFDLVSRSSDDKSFGSASAVVIGGKPSAAAGGASQEGRFLVFRSGVTGLAGNDNGYHQIFWRDRLTGVTRLVSHTPDGKQSDDNCDTPAISADGQTVAFVSSATTLVADDTNKQPDVFVWSAADDTVKRVSVGSGGEQADGPSQAPTLSGDGRVIAFATNATTIAPTPDDSGITRKVVRLDLASGERTVVSRNGKTNNPIDADSAMLSHDGKRLVFQTFRDAAGDLATYLWDIFVYEHTTGEVWPVTRSTTGVAHDAHGTCVSCGTIPAISGDGKWVSFPDASTNLVPGVTDGHLHLWLVEVDACRSTTDSCNIQLVDRGPDGTPSDTDVPNVPAPLSYDGRFLSFVSKAGNLGAPAGKYPTNNVYVFDSQASPSVTPLTSFTDSNDGAEERSWLSFSGAYVAFRAGGKLDPRFDGNGAYAGFTRVGDAFFWSRSPSVELP